MLSVDCAKLQEEEEEQNEVEAESPKRKGHKRKARTLTQETDCEDRYRNRCAMQAVEDEHYCSV